METREETLIDSLRWLALAMGTDETRSALTRIYVDGTRAVATDGHRLHWIDSPALPAGLNLRGYEVGLLLETAKVFGVPAVELDENGVSRWDFAGGSAQFRFVWDGVKFVDYKSVLPVAENEREASSRELRKAAYTDTLGVARCKIGPAEFNAAYIADALRGAPKKVSVFESKSDESPVLFRYENRGAVVMPMRKGSAK